jgi:GT2 family glycosyltransferase
MNKFSLTIVIPNWNGLNLLQKYLRQTIKVCENSEIIIVDDGSTDGSIEYLHSNFPEMNVIAKSQHEGFASSVNVGVKHAHGDVVVLLNTDVVPEKGFLEPLLLHFENPKVFAVGCMDKSYEKGKVVYRGRGLAKWKNGFYVHERGEINRSDTAWVSGGSGAFRKKYWDLLGGMDEKFNPFYWEDIDLSYRAIQAGFEVLFEAKSLVNHYHEEGKIRTDYTMSQIKQIAYRNQFIFAWKHIPSVKIWLVHVFYVPVVIIRSFIKNDLLMWKGFISALPCLPQIIFNK